MFQNAYGGSQMGMGDALLRVSRTAMQSARQHTAPQQAWQVAADDGVMMQYAWNDIHVSLDCLVAGWVHGHKAPGAALLQALRLAVYRYGGARVQPQVSCPPIAHPPGRAAADSRVPWAATPHV